MKLAIGVCCNRDAKPKFLKSLLYLVSKLHTVDWLESLDLLLRENVSNLSNGRESVLCEAEEMGATHLLFLDDDMVFPPDIVERLYRHRVAVVGVNYVTKDPAGPKPTAMGLDGQFINSAKKSGLERVGRLGFGCVLVRLGALKKVLPPRFPVQWVPQISKYRTEDYAFFDLLGEHRIAIHCDHDLSKEIGHVGSFVYTFSNCVEKADRGGDRGPDQASGGILGDVPQGGRGDSGPLPTPSEAA